VGKICAIHDAHAAAGDNVQVSLLTWREHETCGGRARLRHSLLLHAAAKRTPDLTRPTCDAMPAAVDTAGALRSLFDADKKKDTAPAAKKGAPHWVHRERAGRAGREVL
jgi:hypothetical protein